jgi:hypothetical protein
MAGVDEVGEARIMTHSLAANHHEQDTALEARL